ncbi:Leucine Rich repeats (2 copies) [Rubripirellula amarantea]|uniref:Leucine Rich repeats (2 copies) n=1 Tax=Rubripirellula amarantea TaxID=2527999 RepID=A0A5C5WUL3_9BACT|nr:hypothetical protein [Rubripirellula amarantea]TWT54336.1 Leucine Rich repeats (2 copies) [Rubripirellula amarantea]
MYLVFEYLFYLGLALTGIGVLWTLVRVFQGQLSRVSVPILVLCLGLVAIATPALYTRFADVDLGPRIVLVQGEKHITLTGWDRTRYDVLRQHPETIVLQMGNPDVTDATLEYLAPMANLRELDLNDTKVTDAGVAKLSTLTGLQVLRLRATSISDAALDDHLSKLPQLNRLDVRETFVTKDAVDRWKAAGEGRRAFQ